MTLIAKGVNIKVGTEIAGETEDCIVDIYVNKRGNLEIYGLPEDGVWFDMLNEEISFIKNTEFVEG
jgi:hypothetical protein